MIWRVAGIQVASKPDFFAESELKFSWFSGFVEASGTGDAIVNGCDTRTKSITCIVVGDAVSRSRTKSCCRASAVIPGMLSICSTPVVCGADCACGDRCLALEELAVFFRVESE